MEDQIILESENLRKEFGALVAVDNVSIQVRANTFHSIIGPNGAGKTTFFNLLSGTLEPTSGRVIFKGQDITRMPVHRTIHKGIGRSFQITNIFPNLSVLENIRLAGQALGHDNFRFLSHYRKFKSYETRAWEVIQLVGLSDRASMPARTLPHGDQRKLELGMILAPDPEVLLLDEPTVGVDPQSRNAIFENIEQLKKNGCTVIYTTHYMEEAQRLCDRVGIMDHGKLLAIGTVDALIRQYGGNSTLIAEKVDGEEIIETQNPMKEILNLQKETDLRGFRVLNPSLETVFLSLTGRTLRD